jgi:crossover junction endodeoxyribonuclease RuvC
MGRARRAPEVAVILGVDCGLSGALTFLNTSGGATIRDMPTFEIKRGKGKRHDLDGHALYQIIKTAQPDHAFVERPQARPKQSSYATGIFFQTYGEVRGILIACSIPFTIVEPHAWKKNLAVPAEKDGARARASQLMPTLATQWPLKKHHGRAEAALLSLYGARTLGAVARDAVPRIAEPVYAATAPDLFAEAV